MLVVVFVLAGGFVINVQHLFGGALLRGAQVGMIQVNKMKFLKLCCFHDRMTFCSERCTGFLGAREWGWVAVINSVALGEK